MPKKITLPGLVDVHTHLREPGATQKEDFETGTKAAAAGGYTVILDMPNNPIPTVSPQALDQKIALATGRIYCDLGFHFGATKDSTKHFNLLKNKIFGLKVYMNHTTGDLLLEDGHILEEVFSRWPKGKIIMVHAEGETLIKAINFAGKFKSRLHVCHIATKQEIELIKKAKKQGLDISCEVSCHHLFLTEEDAKSLGPFGKVRPPLATEEDRKSLWDNLDSIDMIASDHAPHTKEEKNGPNPPNGVPGLETSLPLLLTAVSEGRLTIEKLIELTNENPRRIFNIPDQPDTFIEVEFTKPYILNPIPLFTKCHWTPFEGMEVRGRVKRVILRGQIVFEDGKISGPFGKVIFPS
ncbi:MAG: hypothetical protein G01um10147_293 [Microgenomates group bacterium Gr01-1014_7]|nr:MAG: hypothetical protein G01um10147_293 [Microgenomates group bacterium Gr01-1014_7]